MGVIVMVVCCGCDGGVDVIVLWCVLVICVVLSCTPC